jgi:hypothetical protein
MTTTLRSNDWKRSPWRLVLWTVPTVLLVTPAIMMGIAAEGWRWNPFDFVFAAVLLFGATGTADLAIRKGGSTAYRLGAGLAVLVSFLLIWVNGAVGVIGDEDNPANLMFVAIIMIAAAGAVAARFEARGMARAMTIAFVLNAAIALLAPVYGWGADEPPGTAGLTMLIGGFAAMWALSAALFAKAARDRAVKS